jgi:hypothetical protein
MADETGKLTSEELAVKAQKLANLNEQYKAYIKLVAEDAEAAAAWGKEMAAVKAEMDDLSGAIEDHNKTVDDAAKATAALKAEYEKTVGTAKTLITGLTGLGEGWKQTAAGTLFATDSTKAWSQAAKETITVQNILGTIMKTVVEETVMLTKSTDEAFVSFNQATGMIDEYGDGLKAAEYELRASGVSIGDLATANQVLIEGFREFTTLTGEQQQELIETTGLLDKMGVSSDAMAKNMDFLSNSVGLTGDQLAQTEIDIYNLGKEIGIGGPAAIEAFTAAGPKLAKFGGDAVDVFADTARAAKEARMSIEELMSVTDTFDKFDTAADSVGRLNALLGGPFLNTMEMVMETDPATRLGMISDALSSAGKDFESMSYYERQAIADAAGLADVSELANIMAGDFDNLTGGMQENSMTQEELREQTHKFNTLAEEFHQVMQMVALQFKPVVDGLKAMLHWVQELLGDSGLGYLIGVIVVAVVVIKGLYTALLVTTGVIKSITAAQAAWGVVKGWFTGVTLAEAAATDTAAASNVVFGLSLAGTLEIMAAAVPVIAALGLAMLEVGAAIFLAAAGFAAIIYASSLVIKSIAMIVEAIGGVVEGLAALSGDQFLQAAMGVAVLAKAISDLPVFKTILLNATFASAAAYEASAAIRESAAANRAAGATNVNVGGSVQQPVSVMLGERKLGGFVLNTMLEALPGR